MSRSLRVIIALIVMLVGLTPHPAYAQGVTAGPQSRRAEDQLTITDKVRTQLNPDGTNYGVIADHAADEVIANTVQSLYFWIVVIESIALVCACIWVYLLQAQRERILWHSALIFRQLWMGSRMFAAAWKLAERAVASGVQPPPQYAPPVAVAVSQPVPDALVSTLPSLTDFAQPLDDVFVVEPAQESDLVAHLQSNIEMLTAENERLQKENDVLTEENHRLHSGDNIPSATRALDARLQSQRLATNQWKSRCNEIEQKYTSLLSEKQSNEVRL